MDQIKKVISQDKKTVVSVIDATDSLQESLERLHAFPTAMVHLGQAMMGAALLHSLWNDKGTFNKVGLQWSVDGPFGHIFSEANGRGEIRGTIYNPQAPVDNYETGIGNGKLAVQKFGNTRSTGIVASQGDICHDILTYLHSSEQRHSTISLSVKIGWAENKTLANPFKVDYALGFLVDVLPHNSKQEAENTLMSWDHFIQDLGPLSQWSLPGDSKVDDIISMLFPKPGKELLFQKIKFHCNCSEDRAERAIKLSEKHDDFRNDDQALEVQCEFCGKKYIFSDDLKN